MHWQKSRSQPSQRDLQPFTSDCVLGERAFEILVDSGSEWILIPRGQKCQCGLLVRQKVYGSQVLSGVLA